MQTCCDASFELCQPYAVRDWAAPFLISEESWKRALILYRVFRKLSFLNLPGFLWREAIRIPAFFIFKKGAGFQLPIISRSPVTRRAAFLFSEGHEKIFSTFFEKHPAKTHPLFRVCEGVNSWLRSGASSWTLKTEYTDTWDIISDDSPEIGTPWLLLFGVWARTPDLKFGLPPERRWQSEW